MKTENVGQKKKYQPYLVAWRTQTSLHGRGSAAVRGPVDRTVQAHVLDPEQEDEQDEFHAVPGPSS